MLLLAMYSSKMKFSYVGLFVYLPFTVNAQCMVTYAVTKCQYMINMLIILFLIGCSTLTVYAVSLVGQLATYSAAVGVCRILRNIQNTELISFFCCSLLILIASLVRSDTSNPPETSCCKYRLYLICEMKFCVYCDSVAKVMGSDSHSDRLWCYSHRHQCELLIASRRASEQNYCFLSENPISCMSPQHWCQR